MLLIIFSVFGFNSYVKPILQSNSAVNSEPQLEIQNSAKSELTPNQVNQNSDKFKIDNLLNQEQYNELCGIILGDYFPWYWNDFINYSQESTNGFQLTHAFYRDNKPTSSVYYLMEYNE